MERSFLALGRAHTHTDWALSPSLSSHIHPTPSPTLPYHIIISSSLSSLEGRQEWRGRHCCKLEEQTGDLLPTTGTGLLPLGELLFLFSLPSLSLPPCFAILYTFSLHTLPVFLSLSIYFLHTHILILLGLTTWQAIYIPIPPPLPLPLISLCLYRKDTHNILAFLFPLPPCLFPISYRFGRPCLPLLLQAPHTMRAYFTCCCLLWRNFGENGRGEGGILPHLPLTPCLPFPLWGRHALRQEQTTPYHENTLPMEGFVCPLASPPLPPPLASLFCLGLDTPPIHLTHLQGLPLPQDCPCPAYSLQWNLEMTWNMTPPMPLSSPFLCLSSLSLLPAIHTTFPLHFMGLQTHLEEKEGEKENTHTAISSMPVVELLLGIWGRAHTPAPPHTHLGTFLYIPSHTIWNTFSLSLSSLPTCWKAHSLYIIYTLTCSIPVSLFSSLPWGPPTFYCLHFPTTYTIFMHLLLYTILNGDEQAFPFLLCLSSISLSHLSPLCLSSHILTSLLSHSHLFSFSFSHLSYNWNGTRLQGNGGNRAGRRQ